MRSLPEGYRALVIGATGGIGGAVATVLEADPRCGGVLRLGRTSEPPIDLTDEGTIERAALYAGDLQPHLVFDATGTLEVDGHGPEKSLSAIEPAAMRQAFAINAIGPALLLKHFAPLLPRTGKSVFATLSARVGSIGDNSLGGWISYRASKAALNQIVRTAAVEIARRHPEAICVALHPGTVPTRLTEAYARGRFTFPPEECAVRLLGVLESLDASRSGGFFAYDGSEIPW
ncbi:MAG: SDR family NAD(P)-dependent oxidoreductase [Alphaproteobacteria bacterium]|nr:SDR family NAD(P)-dependent oxidoreductase [Alphaproteobacteria bacterium]